jgi:hypothetical protein
VGLLDRLVALILSGIDLIDGLPGLGHRSQQARFRCRRRQDLRWWCQTATREQADQKAGANKGWP